MKNAFQHNIPEIKEVLENTRIKEYIEQTLISVLNTLEIAEPQNIVNSVIQMAASYSTKEDYEAKVNKLLQSKGVTKERIAKKLSRRADIIYEQIKEHIKSGKVLDLGCGDGKVGEIISQADSEVMLTDIYKHEHIDDTGLSFVEFKQGEKTPLTGNQYDTVLLLTVMHHSDDPLATLKEAKRLSKKGGIVIAIESVYGVNQGQSDENNAELFVQLSSEEQRLANIYFDHFYNRVVHYNSDPRKKVNVPFNFNTPEGWNQEAANLGLKEIITRHLGIDQPTVPEYHTLHVYELI